MKKFYLFLVVLLVITLNSCTFSGKRYYKTYTGNYVTIWNDYIIFEKYEGRKHPKDNYIKLSYKGLTDVFFKNNDSILIYRRGDENEITGIRVFDTMGKIIYSSNRFNGGEIVLPNAKQGLYYVVVTLKDKTITKKMVIK